MDPNNESGVQAEAGQEQIDERPVEERAVDAFDEGAAEAEDAPAPAAGGDTDDSAGEGEGEAGEGAGAPGEPGAGGDDEPGDAGAGEETDEERAAREQEERTAAAKADDDQAVKELGLRGKAEARFRDLSGQVRDLSQKLEAVGGDDAVKLLTDLGGKQGLDRVVKDAEDQRQWDRHMSEIGCTPEQFGQAMGYLKAFGSDDPAVLKQARDNLLQEVALLDGRLGEKTERHDPLSAHADLKGKVQRGELDEEDALEIARLRGGGQRAQEQAQAQQQQQQQQQAMEQGRVMLSQLGAQLKQRDGDATFAARMAVIGKALDAALPALPPAQWGAYAQQLYDSVQLQQAPKQQRPRVGKGPVRQSSATVGSAGGAHPDTPRDPWSAFDQGVEEAREVGL